MEKNLKKKLKVYVNTIYGRHLCILDPDDKKGFLVTVLGLPGVVTWGKNIEHAQRMAREAIELCVECLVEKAKKKQESIMLPA